MVSVQGLSDRGVCVLGVNVQGVSDRGVLIPSLHWQNSMLDMRVAKTGLVTWCKLCKNGSDLVCIYWLPSTRTRPLPLSILNNALSHLTFCVHFQEVNNQLLSSRNLQVGKDQFWGKCGAPGILLTNQDCGWYRLGCANWQFLSNLKCVSNVAQYGMRLLLGWVALPISLPSRHEQLQLENGIAG